LRFVVGELPEIVEQEIDGDPQPVDVALPVTINGRIFPREDVDVWRFAARKGQTITAVVCAAHLGSPLDSHLEALDAHGRKIAENDDSDGPDSRLHFTAPEDGPYQLRIKDVNFQGGQAYVYRLTVTAGPAVDHVYPLGGRRGSKVRFRLQGADVPADAVEATLPRETPRDYRHRFTVGGQQTNAVLLDVADLPEQEENEPNDTAKQAKALTLPVIANGYIEKPGDVDTWSFTAHKGEAVTLELRARQLGSLLQGVLTVTDAGGKVLGRAEATADHRDPVLTLAAPADGTYFVQVADRFRTHGGIAYAYRLRLGHAVPDYRLQLASDGQGPGKVSPDALTLPRGGQARLRVVAQRMDGFAGPIELRLSGLPAGVSASAATIAAGQNTADITLSTTSFAALGTAHLQVHGSARLDGKVVTRTATLPAAHGESEVDSVLLAVALKPPFKIVGDYDLRLAPRGSELRRRYRIQRNGFTGPLEISLADHQMRHLQGVSGATLTVPAGRDEFEYPVVLPPWLETGRTARACIQAVGVVREGGVEHTVGYSSEGQNEQIIAVVESGKLSLDVDRSSLAAVPGSQAQVKVRIRRSKGLTGPVKLELIHPDHLHGVEAAPVVLGAEQSEGVFTLRFTSRLSAIGAMPVVLRATLRGETGPAIAEAKLELVRNE
jgi:hypothetical protein